MKHIVKAIAVIAILAVALVSLWVGFFIIDLGSRNCGSLISFEACNFLNKVGAVLIVFFVSYHTIFWLKRVGNNRGQ